MERRYAILHKGYAALLREGDVISQQKAVNCHTNRQEANPLYSQTKQQEFWQIINKQVAKSRPTTVTAWRLSVSSRLICGAVEADGNLQCISFFIENILRFAMHFIFRE